MGGITNAFLNRIEREKEAAWTEGYLAGLKAQPPAENPIARMLKRVSGGDMTLDEAVEEFLETDYNPQLTHSPDCGCHVSRRAPSCPHCGAPLDPAS